MICSTKKVSFDRQLKSVLALIGEFFVPNRKVEAIAGKPFTSLSLSGRLVTAISGYL
jgi:hypothetical protein